MRKLSGKPVSPFTRELHGITKQFNANTKEHCTEEIEKILQLFPISFISHEVLLYLILVKWPNVILPGLAAVPASSVSCSPRRHRLAIVSGQLLAKVSGGRWRRKRRDPVKESKLENNHCNAENKMTINFLVVKQVNLPFEKRNFGCRLEPLKRRRNSHDKSSVS